MVDRHNDDLVGPMMTKLVTTTDEWSAHGGYVDLGGIGWSTQYNSGGGRG